MTVKKGDFIELNYTASLVDDGSVFDTTLPDEAEKAGMICDHDHEHEQGHKHVTREDFRPIRVCVGESHVLPGLDEQLVGLSIGEHDVILGEENAFGKKDAKLLKLMPLTAFKKQKINPFVGLSVDMDGSRGVVRSVSGGRVIIDFNHPLAGKAVKYQISILRKVDDLKEKVDSVLSLLRLPSEEVLVKDNEVLIRLPAGFPLEALDNLKGEVERITKAKIIFESGKEKNEGADKKAEVPESQPVKKDSEGDVVSSEVNDVKKGED